MMRKLGLVGVFLSLFLVFSFCFPAFADKSTDLIQQGDLLLKENNPKGAFQKYSEALQADPSNPRVYEALGDYYFQEGRYREAIAEYIKGSSFTREKNPLHFKMGKAYYYAGKYASAVEILSKLVTSYKNSPELFFYLGDSYAQQDQVELARENLEQALRLGENRIRVHISLGKLYLRNKMPRLARRELTRAMNDPSAQVGQKNEINQLIREIDSFYFESQIWHIAIPVLFVIVILVSYRMIARNTDEEKPEDKKGNARAVKTA